MGDCGDDSIEQWKSLILYGWLDSLYNPSRPEEAGQNDTNARTHEHTHTHTHTHTHRERGREREREGKNEREGARERESDGLAATECDATDHYPLQSQQYHQVLNKSLTATADTSKRH